MIRGYKLSSLWAPEFSESLDRPGIHWLAAILQNKKKAAVVFRRPSDDKVSHFLKDLEVFAIIVSIKNLVHFLV